MSIEQANVTILVFAMPGCPACHEYLPKLYGQVEGYQKLGHPFVVYDEGVIVSRGQIPVVIVDSTSTDASVVDLCNKYKIVNLPTTLLMPRHGFPVRFEGDLSPQDIYQLLNASIQTNQ